MLRLRGELLVAAAAIAFAIGVACSSSDDKGSSSSSSGNTSSSGTATGKAFHLCPAANTPANCSSTDVDTYNTCIANKCDTQFQQCFGADYKGGSFSGPCATYLACQQKCSCADQQCLTACQLPAACSTCEQGFATCTSNCELPACYTSDGGTSSSSSSSSGSTGPFTCAQLQTCCAKIPAGDEQDQCNKIAANGEDAGSDTACNISYSSFSNQATGGCD